MNGGNPAPAIIRLALSRERLRLALGGSAMPNGASRQTSEPLTGPGFARPGVTSTDQPSAGKPVPGWLESLLAMPMAQVLIDSLTDWWLRHPLRPVVVLAGATLTVAIKPVAQRHPFGLMAAALLAGGLIAWARPWRHARWALRPALFAGLAQQLLSRTLAELPLQAWLTAWAEMAQSPREPGNPSTPPGKPAAAPPSSS